MRDFSKLDKLGRGSYYSDDHKHFPMTKTTFVKVGGRWKQAGEPEQRMISRRQAEMTLADEGLPFEQSHKHYKKDMYRHDHKWDTFQSISPDGDEKSVWYVNYPEAYRKERKLADKRYYDRERYLKKKAQKAQLNKDARK